MRTETCTALDDQIAENNWLSFWEKMKDIQTTRDPALEHLISVQRLVGAADCSSEEMTVKLVLVMLALFVFATFSSVRESPKVLAAPPQQSAAEGKGCAAPKQWGQVKGVADRTVAFEDSAGTIRVLDLGPCMRGETRLVVQIIRP